MSFKMKWAINTAGVATFTGLAFAVVQKHELALVLFSVAIVSTGFAAYWKSKEGK